MKVPFAARLPRTVLSGKRARHALPATAAVVLGAGGFAMAQTRARYDPAQDPATKGRVAQYSLGVHGDVDGLILDGNTEVHLPPHLGTQLVVVAKPGDTVTLRGPKARELAMVQAMQVTNDASNQSVTDRVPPAARTWCLAGHGPGGCAGHGQESLARPTGRPERRSADGQAARAGCTGA